MMDSMSEEQVVMHVLRNKTDYYKVLMVTRTATTAQVKAAYKKMAFKCHPDKNKHPQAAEAFKLVGSANATLSDEVKREIYNRQGTAGVQRHESSGERGRGNGAAGGPRFRHGGNPQRDFFEEFFGGGAFRQQHQTAGQGRGNANMQYAEFDINPGLLMLIPVVIFVLLALILQSGFTDVNAYGSGSAGAGGFRQGVDSRHSAAASFSLTPSPEEGFVVRRMTTLHGLNVPYYTTRRFADVMERRRDVAMSTEQEVLKMQRDYLGNRCEAETFKHRTRGRKDAPEVCSEFARFRRAMN